MTRDSRVIFFFRGIKFVLFFRDRVKGTGGSDSLWGVGYATHKENVYNKTFKKDDYKTQTVKQFFNIDIDRLETKVIPWISPPPPLKQ